MKRSVWVLAVLVSACGGSSGGDDYDAGGDPSPLPFESGTRLHAVYQDGGDGAVLFNWWHDSELDIDCTFARDEVWELRCLPRASVNLVYLNDTCTQLGFEWGDCGSAAPQPRVRVDLRERCIGPWRSTPYSVGSMSTRTQYYEMGDAGCQPVDLGEARTFYAVNPDSPTDYVIADTEHVAVDDVLGVEVFRAADGASQVSSMVSRAVDQTCGAINIGVDGREYCLHGDWAYDYDRFSSDDACAGGDVAYSVGASFCGPPAYALVNDMVVDGACTHYETSLAAITGELDASAVYEGSGAGSCDPASGRERYWGIGAAVENTLPEVGHTTLGTGRLRADYYATPAGMRLIRGYAGFEDHDRGEPCEQWLTTSGSRCLPPTRHGVYHYADDQCTVPLVAVTDSACFTEPVPVLFATNIGDICVTRLDDPRAVGAEHTGAVYQLSGPDCVAYTPDQQRFYTVGAAGSASFADYPEIVSRVDGE